MYLCNKCGELFDDADMIRDEDLFHFGTPVFTELCVCPACGSDDYAEAAACAVCGDDMPEGKALCDACERELIHKTDAFLETLHHAELEYLSSEWGWSF